MTHQELLAQAAELTAKAQELRKQELAGAIDKIKAIMAEYGITPEDFGAKRTVKAERQAMAAKYRDPASGQTWSGKGRKPNFVLAHVSQGHDIGTLAIN